jgi:hypothetical protein
MILANGMTDIAGDAPQLFMLTSIVECPCVATGFYFLAIRINMLAKELIVVGSSARGISIVSGTKCREVFFR